MYNQKGPTFKQRALEAFNITTNLLVAAIIVLIVLSPLIYWGTYFVYCKVYHFSTPNMEAPNFCKK